MSAKKLTTQQARMVAMVLYGRDLDGGHAVIGQVAHGRSRGYMVGYTNTLVQRSVITGTSMASYVSAFIVAAGENPAALADTFTAIEAVQFPERGVECPECGADPGEQCIGARKRHRFDGKRPMLERAHNARHAEYRKTK